jgi:carbamoyltransferase
MGYILGISGFYHDAAAALVEDGRVIAAAQEERFTRKKHDPRFPINAINYCLEEAFIEADELEAVVFYDHPVITLDRVIKSLLTVAPKGAAQWAQAAPSVLGVKLAVADRVRAALNLGADDVPIYFTRHHLAHAASAFYPSPFEEAAVLTIDGVGEWATTSLAHGRGAQLKVLSEIHYPHSLGLLYSAFTYHTGFRVNSGEYKLMGLAPYGQPVYADRIREHLITLHPDGSFALHTEYFGFLDGDVMTNERFAAIFDGPPRAPETRIGRREMDLAASVQVVLEEAVLNLARQAKAITGAKHLCLAGGVALNCVANGKLLRAGLFEGLWVQPAAGDAGGALGAALVAAHGRYDHPRFNAGVGGDGQSGSLLGPAWSGQEVRAFLGRRALPFTAIPALEARAEVIAGHLAAGRVVGHYAGRMEFGPRALGARSILGDPRSGDTQQVMNLKIKYRESFRPFAPAVLEEHVSAHFEHTGPSPYMLLVAPVLEAHRLPRPAIPRDPDDLLEIVKQPRSHLPAITHVDDSARLQTVGANANPSFRAILQAFEAQTGCPVVVNTSFNVRGEPIVASPEDAWRCFMRTEMDVLVLEDCILLKTEQPAFAEQGDWREVFELD